MSLPYFYWLINGFFYVYVLLYINVEKENETCGAKKKKAY